ncbi:MAG: cysteine desulfurase [Candidatus Heimdallarchaeota archaeon]|nr:cysteine desulfurase [Candidatus Heimdallarchaeota archaeon]
MSEIDKLLDQHGTAIKEVYLDWENGSKLDKEVLDAMIPFYLDRKFGNPAITHRFGWETYDFYLKAKKTIAKPLNVDPQSLALTHSFTESNNLAIKGIVKANKKKKKIIVSEVEHLSVIHSAKSLFEQGIKVDIIPVSNDGVVNLDLLRERIDDDTLLVSIQAVNHEIGTIQPVKEAFEIVKDKNEEILFHTDATSAFGRLPLDYGKLEVDLATISSDRILGPKGIAGLYVKEGTKIKSLYEGQLSVEVLSPDVENSPLLAGFVKAVEIHFDQFEKIKDHTSRLRDKLLYGFQTTIPRTNINGPQGINRAPDNVNISFLGCEGEALTVESSMKGIYASSGSACTSRVLMPSHILTAIGRKPEEAHGSLLMKITRLNTEEEIKYVLETMPKVIERIRSITGGIEL